MSGKAAWFSLKATLSPLANWREDYSTTTRVRLSTRDSIEADCYGPPRRESGWSLTNVLVVEQSQVAKTESFHSCVVLEGVNTLQSLKEAVSACHARGSSVVLVQHGQWSKDLLKEIDQGLYAPTNFLMLFQEKDKPKVVSWVRYMKLKYVAEIMKSCEWHEDITTVYSAYVRLVDSLPSSHLKLLSQDYSLIPACTQQNFPFILDFICVYYKKMGEGVSVSEKAKLLKVKEKECMAVLQAHVIDREWSVEAVQQAAACIPESEFFNSILLESMEAKKYRNNLNKLWLTFLLAKKVVPSGPGSRVLEQCRLRSLTPAQLGNFSKGVVKELIERGDISSMSVKEAWKLFTGAKLDAPHALLQLFVNRRCGETSSTVEKLLDEVKALQSECGPEISDLYGGAIDPSVFAESTEATEWIAFIRDKHPGECVLLLLPQLAVAWHWPDTAMPSVSQKVVRRSLTSQEVVLSMCALCTSCGIQEPLLSMVAEEVRSSHFIVSNVVEAFDRFPKRYKWTDTSNHTVWNTLTDAFIHAVFINDRVALDSSAIFTSRTSDWANTTMTTCVQGYVWDTMGAENHLKDIAGLLTIIRHAARNNKTMLVWAVEVAFTGKRHVLNVPRLLSSVTNSPLHLLTDIDQALQSCPQEKLSFLPSKIVSDVRSAVVESLNRHTAAWGTIAAWSCGLHWLVGVLGDTAIPRNVMSLTRTDENEKLSLSADACQKRCAQLGEYVRVLSDHAALLGRAATADSVLFEANLRDAFKKHSEANGESILLIKVTIDSAVEFTKRILRHGISVTEAIDVASVLRSNDDMGEQLTKAHDVVLEKKKMLRSEDTEKLVTTLQLVPLANEVRPHLIKVFTGDRDNSLAALDFACHDNPRKEPHHAKVCDFVRRHGSTTEPVDLNSMKKMVQDLMAALGTQNPREAVNLVALLASLRTGAYHLWEFFGKNPIYVSEKGGLSDALERRIDEEFIPYLKGAREHIFKAFRQCSYVVAALRANAPCDKLSALGANVLASRHVVDQLQSEGFVERAEAVSQNMDMISSLFDNGINSDESAMRQFGCIEDGCVYVFDLVCGNMSAHFYEAAMKEISCMGSTDLRDFQQRLSLVTHSQSTHTDSANKYVERLGTLSAALRCMVALRTLGHPEFNVAKVRLDVGNCLLIVPSVVSECSVVVNEAVIAGIQSTLDSWQEKVTGAFASNAMLSLLSVKSAQVLAAALIGKKDLDTVVRQMGPLLPRGNGCGVAQRNAMEGVKQCLQNFGASGDWLTVVQSWLAKLPAHCFFSASAAAMSPVCRVYTNCTTHADVLKALADLYSLRPPLPFEYMRCTPATSELQVAALRDRSRLHPNLQFVMVGSGELSVSAQKILFGWLSSVGEAYNISLIEEDAKILHSLRWIPHVSCSELRVDVAATIKQRWRSADMAVQCFTGSPGSGKSYQVSRHTASASGVHCSVDITENFEMGAAVEELRRRVPVTGTDDAALAITFSCGVYDEHTTATGHASALRLASDMNNFLFALLVLRDLEDPVTGQCASVVGAFTWRVFIEVPHQLVASTADDALLPLLPHLGDISCARDYRIDLDASDLDTAKYLRAYNNGIIDTLYQYEDKSKDVMFVLDVSGSMMGDPLAACQDALLQHILPDKIHKGDRVGFIAFNDQIQQNVPLDDWTPVHHMKMKEAIKSTYTPGGTLMWPPITIAIQELRRSTTADVPQWVVVLTDGETHSTGAEYVTTLLSTSEKDGAIGMIFITIDLQDDYRAYIAQVCNLQNHDAFISVSNSREAIIEGWNKAGEKLCDRIEREGADITEDEARALLFEHMQPADHPEWSRVHICYWLRYMARRRHILKCSKNFNTNSSRPNFGSLTMRMMLAEVEHAVSALLGWREAGHRHMVYYKETDEEDGTENYDWSIVATDCEADKRWNETRTELLGNGMCPPTAEDLADPGVLESYLAAVIGAPLVSAAPRRSSAGTQLDIPVGRLDLIRTRRFVLTADFLMKMITLHERVECGVPCILVGETGVSKTALTRMYFELRNSAQAVVGPLQAKLQAHYGEQQGGDATSMHSVLFPEDEEWEEHVPGLLAELRVNIQCVPTNAIVDQWLPLLLSEKPSKESFQEVAKWWLSAETQRQAKAGSSSSSPLFEMINVDATTTPDDIREVVRRVKTCSKQFSKMGTLLGGSVHDKVRFCVFFDEFNTTSCMGFIKALLQDHRMDGDELPRNIVFVAAANPAREKISFHDKRKEEHALAWVATHYQVHSIPPALRSVAWDYGSLSEKQEMEFIERLLTLEGLPNASRELECFAAAHSLCRELATDHVDAMAGCILTVEEKKARSQSVVSLRDILRVVHIYRFLAGSLSLSSRPSPVDHRAMEAIREKVGLTKQQGPAAALLLSIAIVYYLRLGIDENCEDDYRMRFRNIFRSRVSLKGFDTDVEAILKPALEELSEASYVPDHIVKGRGLDEVILTAIVCLAAGVPLMIIGPPGCGKTLGVTVAIDNARGDLSQSPFYRELPKLLATQYQCTRHSNSIDVDNICIRAKAAQAEADGRKDPSLHFVFMDEAGLPEEERESLKVLHYHLEGPNRVSFIGISNHVLDAAKSNRSMQLHLRRAGEEELVEIASMYLMSHGEIRSRICRSGRNTPTPLTGDDSNSLVRILCALFSACIRGKSNKEQTMHFCEHFGQRDFMRFMATIGQLASQQERKEVTAHTVHLAIARNFSCPDAATTLSVKRYFLAPFECSAEEMALTVNPVSMIQDFIADSSLTLAIPTRYTLVIDETASEGVLRALQRLLRDDKGVRTDTHRVTEFGGDLENSQARLVGRVCCAMQHSEVAILCNAGTINECLYNLYNQHFGRFDKGTPHSHVYVAFRTESQLRQVSPGFYCMVAVSPRQYNALPAPFLDRFAKLPVSFANILQHIMSGENKQALFKEVPALRTALEEAYCKSLELIVAVGDGALYGVRPHQTVESALACVLAEWGSASDIEGAINRSCENQTSLMAACVQQSEVCRRLCKCPVQDGSLTKVMTSESTTSDAHCLLVHVLLSCVVDRLLLVAIPEEIVPRLHLLPKWLAEHYLTPPYFSICLPVDGGARKLVVTRLSEFSVRQLCEPRDTAVDTWMFLSQFTRESHFVDELTRHCTSSNSNSGPPKTIAVVASTTTSSLSQVNFTVSTINAIFGQNSQKQIKANVIVIVCVPGLDAVHHTYDAVFEPGWSVQFLESSASSLNLLPWLLAGFTECNNNSGDGDDGIKRPMQELLRSWLPSATERAVEMIVSDDKLTSDDTWDALDRIIGSQRTGKAQAARDMLIDQFYEEVWSLSRRRKDGLRGSIGDEIVQCVRAHAEERRCIPLVYSLEADVRHMFQQFVSMWVCELLASPTSSSSVPVDELLCLGLSTMHTHSVGTLRRATMRCRATSQGGIPFFGLVFGCLKSISQEVIASYAQDEDEDGCVWQRMSKTAEEYLRDSVDSAAPLARKCVELAITCPGLVPLYIDNLAAAMLPGGSDEQLQFVTDTLNASVYSVNNSSALIQLHLHAEWNAPLIEDAVSEAAPLDALPSQKSLRDLLTSLLEEGKTTHTSKLISAYCTESLRYCSSDPERRLPGLLQALRNRQLARISSNACSASKKGAQSLSFLMVHSVHAAARLLGTSDADMSPLISVLMGTFLSTTAELKSLPDVWSLLWGAIKTAGRAADMAVIAFMKFLLHCPSFLVASGDMLLSLTQGLYGDAAINKSAHLSSLCGVALTVAYNAQCALGRSPLDALRSMCDCSTLRSLAVSPETLFTACESKVEPFLATSAKWLCWQLGCVARPGVLGAVEVLEALHRSGAVLLVVAARAHLVRCMADSLKRGESLPWQNTQFVQHVKRLADAENGYAQLLAEDAVSLNCTAQSETCKFFAKKVVELTKLNAHRPGRSATTARRHPLFVVPDITALSINASMDTLLKERQFLRSLWVLCDMQDLHRRLDDLITYGCDERQSCGSVCIDEETDSLFSRVAVGVYVLSSCLPSHKPVVLTREMQLSELVLSTDSDGQPRRGLLHSLMDNVLVHYNSISGKLPWRDRCSVGQALIASDIDKVDIDDVVKEGCREGALTEQFMREVSVEWDMKGWWTQELYLWADWHSAEKPWDTLLTRHVDRELLYSVSHDTALTAMPTLDSNAARIIGRKESQDEARQSSGYYNKVFHSLDVTQIRALLDMVRSAQECSRTSTLLVGTLEDVLKNQHPNRNVADVITNRVGSISEEQKLAICNLCVEDMPAAVDFLRGQLETRAYMFADVGLHLKLRFDDGEESHINSALATWTDAPGVRTLDSVLSEAHATIMAQHSECNLLTVLRGMYRSETDLLRCVPLLKVLLEGGSPLLCGH